MNVEFTIHGEPCGKGRPRFSRQTGRTYTPTKTANYENLVKLEYINQCGQDRFEQGTELAMEITAYYSIPESKSKKQKQLMRDGVVRPTKKPDMDNVVKIIADSLNKIAYHDDSQIVALTINKWYSDEPRVVVNISKNDEKNAKNDGKIENVG